MNPTLSPADRVKQGGEGEALGNIGHVGLLNLGNTCFMNSGLQVLLSSKHLVKAVMESQVQEESGHTSGRITGKAMHVSFKELIYASRTTKADIYKPDKIKNAASRLNKSFIGYGQQDSFELIQTVLDGLEKETNRAKEVPYKALNTDGMEYSKAQRLFRENHREKYDSPITEVTCTELAKCVMCTGCQLKSYSFSYCQALLLDLPVKGGKNEGNKKRCEKQGWKSNSLSLSALINNSEKAYAVDNYYCSECKAHRRVNVREWISEPAKCLIIQLKRFRNNDYNTISRFFWGYSKNDAPVEYEDTLEIPCFEFGQNGVAKDDMQPDGTCPASEVDSSTDLSVDYPTDKSSTCLTAQESQSQSLPRPTRSYKYQYRGASLHSGGLGGGHYTALCYGCNDKYYYCNDSSVTLVDKAKLDAQAYVLLFDRVDP